MKYGRLLVVVVVLALLAALFGFGLLRGSPDRDVASVLVGKAAPAFDLPLYERYQPEYGPRFALADHVGRPMVVNFWASWCLPCYEEAPVLQKFWSEHQDEGVLVVGVQTQDRDKRSEGRDFIGRFGLTFPNAYDNDSTVSVDWALYGVPETFFLDAAGNVVAKHVGPVTAEVLARNVEALLR